MDTLQINGKPTEITIASDLARLSGNLINWALFFTAAFLVYTNLFVSTTIFPAYAVAIGGTPLQSGLQNTLFFVTAVCLRFYCGPIADRHGRKPLLLLGAFAFATTPLLLLASSTIWMLFLARIYQAVGLATFLQCGSALTADLAPVNKRGRYLGVYRLLSTLSVLLGPPAALALVELAGYRPLFICSFLIGGLAVALLLFVQTPKILTGGSTLFPARSVLEVLRNVPVRPLLAGIALVSIGYSTILTYVVNYIAVVTSLDNPGIYFICFGLVGIAANLGAGYLSDRFGRRPVAWPALIILGIGTMVLPLAPISPTFVIVSSILTGTGVYGGLLVLSAWLIDLSEERIRATTLSVQENTIDLSFAAGALITGLVGGWLGLPAAFFAIGLLILTSAAALLAQKHKGVHSGIT